MIDRSGSDADGARHPHPPQTPPPGLGFEERLAEREIWTDRFGVAHRLEEMADDYLWAVLGYLRWYAPEIRSLRPDGDAVAEVPLRLWLEMQPIWGAIACELVRRGAVGHPSLAMERLMVNGPVPWELTGRPELDRPGGR